MTLRFIVGSCPVGIDRAERRLRRQRSGAYSTVWLTGSTAR